MTTTTTHTRLIDQYNPEISLEDAIALATGEGRKMWSISSDWSAENEEGILWTTLVDVESWEACKEEYTLSATDIFAEYQDILAERLNELEDSLEPQEAAIMTEAEKVAEVCEDVAEGLREWQATFEVEALEIWKAFSCPVLYWENLVVSI